MDLQGEKKTKKRKRKSIRQRSIHNRLAKKKKKIVHEYKSYSVCIPDSFVLILFQFLRTLDHLDDAIFFAVVQQLRRRRRRFHRPASIQSMHKLKQITLPGHRCLASKSELGNC